MADIEKFLLKSIKAKSESLLQNYAEIGLKVAEEVLNNSVVDVLTDGSSGSPQSKAYMRKEDDGYVIGISGEDATFIEFGAGVHFNSEPYPMEKPSGIKDIGEYGQGRGKQDKWAFGIDGQWTYGTPASMPIYNARKAILEEIEKDNR